MLSTFSLDETLMIGAFGFERVFWLATDSVVAGAVVAAAAPCFPTVCDLVTLALALPNKDFAALPVVWDFGL
jgi:hypothetical protein